MSVTFRIMPDRDLVLVTYTGTAGIDETAAVFEDYARHPDFRPGQRHLFDVRGVTEVEKDFVRFFAMQARMVEVYGQGARDQIVVFLAPNRAGQEMALMAVKSWEANSRVVIRILDTEADALSVLGQPEQTLAELAERTA